MWGGFQPTTPSPSLTSPAVSGLGSGWRTETGLDSSPVTWGTQTIVRQRVSEIYEHENPEGPCIVGFQGQM